MMAVYNRGLAKWDAPLAQHRYGPFLSVVGAVPAVCAAQLPFASGAQHENDVLGLGRMRGWVVYCRDDGNGGRVALGPKARCSRRLDGWCQDVLGAPGGAPL